MVGVTGVAGGGRGKTELNGIYSLIEEKMAEYNTTGVAFGVYRNGWSTFRGFGSKQKLPRSTTID